MSARETKVIVMNKWDGLTKLQKIGGAVIFIGGIVVTVVLTGNKVLVAMPSDIDALQESELEHAKDHAEFRADADTIKGDVYILDAGLNLLICDRRRRRAELGGQPFSEPCEDNYEDALRRRRR